MRVIVGVDIGGTKISVSLGTMRGRIIGKIKLKTQLNARAYQSLDEIVDAIHSLLCHHTIAARNLVGIGIAIPGPTAADSGVIGRTPNLPGWEGMRVGALLRRRFQCPVFSNNDANAACLGEKLFGIGKKSASIVYITISTGVGCGIILENKLILGKSNNAGELGHIPLDMRGPHCNCGKKGCLEALASGTAIARMAVQCAFSTRLMRAYTDEYAYEHYCRRYPRFRMRGSNIIRRLAHHGPENVDALLVANAAACGDGLARYIYWRAGYYFGVGLAVIMQLVNPELFILGGSVLKAGDLFTRPMRDSLQEHSWPEIKRVCSIKRTSFGSMAGDVGALSLVVRGMKERS